MVVYSLQTLAQLRAPVTCRLLLAGLSAMLFASGCHWSATGRNITGTALHHEGRYHEAIQSFQDSLNADPLNSDTYYNLAASYHSLGKVTSDQSTLAQAEQLYNQCLDISPEHSDCHRGLACLLVETGRPDRAFTLLHRWQQRSPQTIDAQIELARLHEEFGDHKSAIAHLEQALAINADGPQSARAWAALAHLREKSGDTQQALMDYRRSNQINPYQPAVAERIAAIQRSYGIAPPPPTPETAATRVVNAPLRLFQR